MRWCGRCRVAHRRCFRVRETAVVDSRTAAVATDEAVSALVLLTCYPFDAVMAGGPLRYVVTAERADG